jgi:hypothetical protein
VPNMSPSSLKVRSQSAAAAGIVRTLIANFESIGIAQQLVLLVLAMPDGPAVVVDPAFWPTATIALNLAPLKVRQTLEIKPVVIIVVITVIREVCMYCYGLISRCLARSIANSGRVR